MSQIAFEHKMAAHCESGTITSLLNYGGMPITEPMVFGISGGIFFGYLTSSNFNFPTFIVRSRPGELRTNIAKRLGIKWEEKKFRDYAKASAALDAQLQAGIPAACQVDFFYMDYMPEWQRVHINVHFITVIGREGDEYIVSDSYYPKIARLSADSMRKARFAGGFMAPSGFMYRPLLISAGADLKLPVMEGIRKACRNMVSLPVPFVGVKGIYKLAKKITEWPKLARDTEHLSHEIMKINVLLEDQGTGGAGFRYMYATFLQQAAPVTGLTSLTEMSERMMKIGDDWRQISYFAAKIGKNRDLGADRIAELSGMIRRQGDAEQEFFTDLKKIVKK